MAAARRPVTSGRKTGCPRGRFPHGDEPPVSAPLLPTSMMPKVPNSLQQQRLHPPAQHFYLAAGGGEPISGRTRRAATRGDASGCGRRTARGRREHGGSPSAARRGGGTTRRRRADERAGAAGPRSPSARGSAHRHRAQR